MRRASEPIPKLAIPEAFAPDEPQLVAVSGGRDSIALLHWLHMHDFKNLIAVHLDHRLRAESGEDSAFVKEFARKLGIECVTGTADVATLAKRGRLSIETAARHARHEFFARIALERACPRIFLAHHADDQVETFLHNLLRGAGPSGLCGMSAVSTLEMHGTALLVARPLLGTWREEIDAYIARHKLPFREDASNADPAFTRNRIRHSIVPALTAAMGRDVRAVLLRTAKVNLPGGMCARRREKRIFIGRQ